MKAFFSGLDIIFEIKILKFNLERPLTTSKVFFFSFFQDIRTKSSSHEKMVYTGVNFFWKSHLPMFCTIYCHYSVITNFNICSKIRGKKSFKYDQITDFDSNVLGIEHTQLHHASHTCQNQTGKERLLWQTKEKLLPHFGIVTVAHFLNFWLR